MKKTNLLLVACFAFAASLSALDWPTDFSFNAGGGCWFSTPLLADADLRADARDATAEYLGESFQMPDFGDNSAFDDIFFDGFKNLYTLDSLRWGTTALANDGLPAYGVGFDDEAIYVFLSYSHVDQGLLNDDFNAEIMFCPYDKLVMDDPESESPLWLRYRDLGGIKFNFTNKINATTNPDGEFKIANYMAVVNSTAGFVQDDAVVAGSHYGDLVEVVDCSTDTELKTVLKVSYKAMDNRLDAENKIPFTQETWLAACNERGLSFEVKLSLDNSKTSADNNIRRSYMWNCGSNDAYYSNSFTGYLAMGSKVPPAVVSEIAIIKGVAHVDGSTVTKAEEGAAVTILSEERSGDGFSFVEWTSDSQDDLALLEDVKAAVTTFTMPAHAVVFTAIYSHISTEGAVVKNMSILDNQIVLAQPADVEIINAATGIVVIKVSNETKVSLSGLTNGVYIAKSGNEVIKFVK